MILIFVSLRMLVLYCFFFLFFEKRFFIVELS